MKQKCYYCVTSSGAVYQWTDEDDIPGQYYVYICYYKGVPVYIGKGKGDRINHCISGKSTSPKLNELYFKDRDNLSVKKVKENTHNGHAKHVERELIREYRNKGYRLFNVH